MGDGERARDGLRSSAPRSGRGRGPGSRCRLGRGALAASAALAVMVLPGCRSVVTVAVVVDESGGGIVTVTAELDAEAAAALGGPERLARADVTEAGWGLAEPDVAEDGSLVVTADRPFADADELDAVLAEIGGTGEAAVLTAEGPDVVDALGRTQYRVSLDASASGDPAAFSDEALTALLEGLPLGRTPEELVAEGVTTPGAGELVVTVVVPGGEVGSATVDLTAGEPRSATATSASTVWQPVVVVLVVVAVVAVLGAAAVAVRALLRRRGRAG